MKNSFPYGVDEMSLSEKIDFPGKQGPHFLNYFENAFGDKNTFYTYCTIIRKVDKSDGICGDQNEENQNSGNQNSQIGLSEEILDAAGKTRSSRASKSTNYTDSAPFLHISEPWTEPEIVDTEVTETEFEDDIIAMEDAIMGLEDLEDGVLESEIMDNQVMTNESMRDFLEAVICATDRF